MIRIAVALAAVALLGACAPLPPPGRAPTPPVSRPAEPPGASASGPLRIDREPVVDVGLAWDMDTLRVTGDDLRIQTRELSEERPVPFVRVGLGPIGMRVGDPKDPTTLLHVASDDTLWVTTGSGSRGLAWNGKTWRGAFKIFLNPRKKLSLAVHVPLETYLLGVVPGEIGALAEPLIEAGKAQAIAARSYTLYYHGRRAAEGFDLYGTVEDQVYGPIESERPLATRCVEETRGRLAMFDGRPIRANYCATCGGITAEVWEAWPTPAEPYLVSHLDYGEGFWCANAPNYRWREEWKPAELAADIAQYAPLQQVTLPRAGVGEILDVSVGARSRSGRVWWLQVTTTTGRIVIPGYATRFVLRRSGNPAAILRSTLFKIDVRRDRRTRKALAIVASGAGSGHGVGLCQTGALGMARAGNHATDILRHYYPGARVERSY